MVRVRLYFATSFLVFDFCAAVFINTIWFDLLSILSPIFTNIRRLFCLLIRLILITMPRTHARSECDFELVLSATQCFPAWNWPAVFRKFHPSYTAHKWVNVESFRLVWMRWTLCSFRVKYHDEWRKYRRQKCCKINAISNEFLGS